MSGSQHRSVPRVNEIENTRRTMHVVQDAAKRDRQLCDRFDLAVPTIDTLQRRHEYFRHKTPPTICHRAVRLLVADLDQTPGTAIGQAAVSSISGISVSRT
jgi:hypothetical protein